jgi:hypothetical protein
MRGGILQIKNVNFAPSYIAQLIKAFMENDKAEKFGVWRYIFIPLLLAIIPLLFNLYFKDTKVATPKFLIQNPIVDSVNTTLKVELLNPKIFTENETKSLLFEINGLLFSTQSANTNNADPKVVWLIDFKDLSAPPSFFKIGTNTIILRLIENDNSVEMKFFIKEQIKPLLLVQKEKTTKSYKAKKLDINPETNSVDKDSLKTSIASVLPDEQLKYYVVMGAFLMLDRAKSRIAAASDEGFSGYIAQFPGSTFFSVIAGEFDTQLDAYNFQRTLEVKHIDGFIRAAPKGLKHVQ